MILARRSGFGRPEKVGKSQVVYGRLGSTEVVLLWPQTFMNESGRSVREVLRRHGLTGSQLLVVHDDLDLPLGRLRVRWGGSAGGQNGVRSIIDCIGSMDFYRLKIGIGRPPEGEDPVDYVLGRFTPAERKKIEPVLSHAADAVGSVVELGPETAMAQYNGRDWAAT